MLKNTHRDTAMLGLLGAIFSKRWNFGAFIEEKEKQLQNV